MFSANRGCLDGLDPLGWSVHRTAGPEVTRVRVERSRARRSNANDTIETHWIDRKIPTNAADSSTIWNQSYGIHARDWLSQSEGIFPSFSRRLNLTDPSGNSDRWASLSVSIAAFSGFRTRARRYGSDGSPSLFSTNLPILLPSSSYVSAAAGDPASRSSARPEARIERRPPCHHFFNIKLHISRV